MAAAFSRGILWRPSDFERRGKRGMGRKGCFPERGYVGLRMFYVSENKDYVISAIPGERMRFAVARVPMMPENFRALEIFLKMF